MAQVFISYARSPLHDDRNIAEAIRNRLVSMGLSVFWDRDIQPGQNFANVLDQESRTAQLVLSLWSEHSLGQEWVTNECRVAKGAGTLFPVRIDSAVVPVEFNGLQHLDFDDQKESSWRLLIERLGSRLQLTDLPTRFELSIRPLIAESTTAESTNVKTILDEMERQRITIPNYQRDGGEWDEKTKSEFIESVINNLAIPAFFFERAVSDGREIHSVVDGQQRLTTLEDFHAGRFALNTADKAEYISQNSLYYAGKRFHELPDQFKEALETYRLTIIKLRNLGDMRLEVFRRINSGGEPLSDQDIRLAYYGTHSPTVTLIRLVGIYDRERKSSKRFLDSAGATFQLAYPWTDTNATALWRELWNEKVSALGQAASELFLLSLVAAQYNRINKLMSEPDLLSRLRVSQNRTLSHALSIYCARSAYEDAQPGERRLLYSMTELKQSYFPHFQEAFVRFQSGKHRIGMLNAKQMAMTIGAMYRVGVKAKEIGQGGDDRIRKLTRSPKNEFQAINKKWPAGKGVWAGSSGHSAQMRELAAYLRATFKRPADKTEDAE